MLFRYGAASADLFALSLHDALPISDGSLLFSSTRPDPEGEADEDQSAIWSLPATGEARVLASAPGGLSVMGQHPRSEEHTSELQSRGHLVCRLLLEKKKKTTITTSRNHKGTRTQRRQP